jgi:hypothetical protein
VQSLDAHCTTNCYQHPEEPVNQPKVNTGPTGNDPLYDGCNPFQAFPECAGIGGYPVVLAFIAGISTVVLLLSASAPRCPDLRSFEVGNVLLAGCRR